MKRASCWWLMFLGLCFSHLAQAQTQAASVTAVPRLVKFSGTLHDGVGKPLTGITGITFALYADESGGSPLWLETQNVDPLFNWTDGAIRRTLNKLGEFFSLSQIL